MSELKDRWRGRPAAVLGGGPSLPGDMARLPDGCVLIAVNYHALRLCQPDVMVYNDSPDTTPEMEVAVEMAPQLGILKVSQDQASSDVAFDVPVWTGYYSSNTAAWLALWLGCEPVILCGMDCYQGERVYFHEYTIDVPSFHYPLDFHTRIWIEEGRKLLPNVERLRVMSGPLQQVFPAYEVQQ